MKRTLTAVVLGVVVVLISWAAITANAGFRLEYAEGVARDDGMSFPVTQEVVYPLPVRPVASSVAVQAAPRLQSPTRLPVAVPTIPPVVSAPAGSVKARVLAAWPGDDIWAARTVNCESEYSPTATGGTGDRYWGLWQFGPWARGRDGMGDPRVQSIEVQTQRAWSLIKATSSSQWSCSPYSYNP